MAVEHEAEMQEDELNDAQGEDEEGRHAAARIAQGEQVRHVVGAELKSRGQTTFFHDAACDSCPDSRCFNMIKC